MKKYLLIGSVSFVLLVIIFASFILLPINYSYGKISTEIWNVEEEFLPENSVVIQKNPNQDFVVLNLADVQFNNYALFDGDFFDAKTMIRKMIEQKQPDLITMTGDNFAGGPNFLVIRNWISFIDSFNIPWAPVMGNHDFEGSGDYNWVADQFLKSENCLLKKGDANLGVGNYVICIMEEDVLVHSIIMMDSHNYLEDGYDYIWQNQLDWYSWVISGLNNYANDNVLTSVLFHIPLVEYIDAYNFWEQQNFDDSIGFGEKNEDVDCSNVNSGFFELIKSLNSTKLVLCGHEHNNNYSIEYQGIRLTYAVKSSKCSYHNDNLGGTVLYISNSDVSVEQYIA